MNQHEPQIDPDIRPIQIVNQLLLDELSSQAKAVPRQRMNHNLHLLEDSVQRMLNALEPATYVRPHRHVNPPKCELFVILRGRLALLFFDDHGTLQNGVILAPGSNCAVDIPAGHWHSLVALEEGTVAMEAKNGPYVPSTDKDFAPWAPTENDPKASAYRESMRLWVQDHLRE